MTTSRRTFITGMAVTAAAAIITTTGPASAKPLPVGSSTVKPTDSIATATYKIRVPEVFRAAPKVAAHTPALVIGTGFGGAVAALRLGQAGITTAMLERGLPWPRDPWRSIFAGEVPPDGRAVWHSRGFTGVAGIPLWTDNFGGVLDVTKYEHINVWRGAAVGGGSVVFTGVLIQPEQRFFEAVFGDSLDFASMNSTYYPKARAMLKASPMPDDIYESQPFGHSRAWDAQAITAGYTPHKIDSIFNWDTIRAELSGRSRKSATIGESNFGNSNGAKYDLTYNYLPDAVGTGKVTIHHGHVVTSIGRQSSGRYVVEVDVVEPSGRVSRKQTLTCDKLFLGAGSIGTSELLVRARETGALPALPSAIGQGWGTNGDAALVRSFSAQEGCTLGTPSASRILDESGDLPVTLENWYIPGLPVNLGMLGSLGMVMDPTRASFRYDSARDDVVLDWPKGGNDRTVRALRTVHDKIAKANNVVAGLSPFAADVNASFTAHPLGGAVLGQATDQYGRVKGYPGLYVVDGALIPGSTGTVNPVLTITALAERIMETVVFD